MTTWPIECRFASTKYLEFEFEIYGGANTDNFEVWKQKICFVCRISYNKQISQMRVPLATRREPARD